jgi:hypothetical protein
MCKKIKGIESPASKLIIILIKPQYSCGFINIR